MSDCSDYSKMTFDEFAQENRLRCESQLGFQHKLASWSTSDWFIAVLGELGEAANVAKKLNRIRDGIRGNKETEAELRDKLYRELGDVFVYLDLLCQSLGFSIGEAACTVFERKSVEIGYPITLQEAQARRTLHRRPVAFRWKNVAGRWCFSDDEEYAARMSDDYQGLYVRDGRSCG